MKRHFSKKLVMTKEGNEDFENSAREMKILRTLLNVGSVIMIILILMLK